LSKFKLKWKIALKNVFKGVLWCAFLLFAFVVGCNFWVYISTKNQVYTSYDKIPYNEMALVLGTSKYSRSGNANLFFQYRMETAQKLYLSKKVKHIIASGDNSRTYYNEPQDMKNALIKRGIPLASITLDYAGFRTFDSVVRSKKIFGQNDITIVTQDFHCYRALFIANYYGMNAVAFAAGGVPDGHSPFTRFREYLARCKAILDLYILQNNPKFLGEPIKIDY
jgi:SanA protein